jgi:hypothetical protein
MSTNIRCIVILLSIVAVSVLMSGCTVNHGTFTVASTKLVRLNEFELDKAGRVKGVQGEDVAHIIVFIPTGTPTLKTAMDNALDQGAGDVLTDVRIETWNFYIPLLYGQNGWSVKGDVVKTRKN